MYILDDKFSQKLFVFDTTGKYLFCVGKKGRGPGEYREINDFAIYQDNIIILSFKSAMFYDLNGIFKFSRKFNWIAENIIVKNDNEVFLFQNSFLTQKEFVPFHVIKTNLRFKKSSEYLRPVKQEYHDFDRFQIFHNKAILTSPPYFSNKIYDVDNSEITTFFSFSFNNQEKSEQEINELKLGDKVKDYPILSKTFFDEESIVFNFTYNNINYIGLYFLKDQRIYTGKRIDNDPLPALKVKQFRQNKIYSSIDSYIFIKAIDGFLNNPTNKNNFVNKELFENIVTSGLSDKSNPIIIRYTLNIP